MFIVYRLNWLMLFSDPIDAGMEFHKIGSLYLILNCLFYIGVYWF